MTVITAFKHLVLVDPVIFDPELYSAKRERRPCLEDHLVAKRRNYFASVNEIWSGFLIACRIRSGARGI